MALHFRWLTRNIYRVPRVVGDVILNGKFHSSQFHQVMSKSVHLPINLDNESVAKDFLSKFDVILTDCDGVVWIDDKPIVGAADTFNALQKSGKKVIFLTNNSEKSRQEACDKLNRLAFHANVDSVITSGYAVGSYLKSVGFRGKVYALGRSALKTELELAGFECVGTEPEPTPTGWVPGKAPLPLDSDIGAVVVSMASDLCYRKLIKACSYGSRGDVLLISTNTDLTYPNADTSLVIPGAGAMVAFVEAVTGRKATDLGKPSKFMFDTVCQVHPDVVPERTVMIGDCLDTDIAFGNNNNLATLFVKTGINSMDDVQKHIESGNSGDRKLVPTYYLNCISDLRKYI